MSKWDEILRKVKEVDKKSAHVGILADKGGSDVREGGITMAEIAAVHEFGSPSARVPQRSFIRRTFREKRSELARVTAKLAKDVLVGGKSVDKALNELGAWGAAEVKKTITAGPGIPPPLSPETVARKGSIRPLVDTGQLLNAITWEVVEG